jgi:uncharacterized phage protein (TIGR01671 family)
MIRENIYRGKRKDNWEWIYGSHVAAPWLPFNDRKDFIVVFVGIESGEPVFDWHEVTSETVGQFTQIIDKNHKDMYSGDIYIAERSHMPSRGRKRKGYPDRIKVICVVEWSVYDAGWIANEISPIKEHIEFDKNCPYHYYHTSLSGSTDGNADWLEIIGNIHDNPELLKQ